MHTKKESQRALDALLWAMGLGLCCILAFAAQPWAWNGWARAIGVASMGIMFAGAVSFGSGALGFLFGIPRTLQDDPSPKDPGGRSAEDMASRVDYRANTNLEQISDWLTKILVGIGLTQLPAIKSMLIEVTGFVSEGMGPYPGAKLMAVGIMAFFAPLGFLFGFLWTRLFLGSALREADVAMIGNLAKEVKENAKKINDMESQSTFDAEALSLASRQLNSNANANPVDVVELSSALDKASEPVRVQVMNQACQQRSENWRSRENLARMERTIPVFRALLETAKGREDHRLYGQLGFALKDKRDPDFRQAEEMLTRAILARGEARDEWPFYEFNRAICRVNRWNSSAPDAELRAQIVHDLRAVRPNDHLWHAFNESADVARWIRENTTEADWRS